MRAVMNHQDMRFLGKGLALVLLLNGLFVTYLLVKPGSPQAVTLVDNLIQGLLEGVGLLLTLVLWLFLGRRKGLSAGLLLPNATATSSGQRWVPLLLSLAVLSYIIGQGIWTYNEDIAHLAVLFPSWADLGFLGSYPFMLLAILFLPRRPLPIWTRIRILLDGLIIMAGVVTFSWYFVLGPTVLRGADTAAGRIIGTAYPLATLLLIFCLLLLAARSHDYEIRPMVFILSLALITIVITDSVYDYQELHNLYATGGLLDVGWPLGYMLIGLSACVMQLQLTSRRPSTPPVRDVDPDPVKSEAIGLLSSLSGALIPLLFVFAVVLLLVWAEYDRVITVLKSGVLLGAIILLGLLVVRQAFVIQEKISQNHLLHRTQQDLWVRNEELLRANKKLEEQAWIEGAYEQQRRLNEMKDQFVLNVSHELRTPFTQVYGYLELLETFHDMLTKDKQMEYIHQAAQGCEALLTLTNTILDVARTDSNTDPPQVQELFLADTVHQVLEQLEPLQRREHPVHLEIAEGLVVQADPQSLCQVLRNLLSNAFKYTPPRTVVRVVATRCDSAAQGQDGTSQACICVQDSGLGIPPEDIPLLFGKFVRLKRDLAGPIPGTGLGLYICKQLVIAMGGSIWVESSGVAGQGSRFYFTLPLSHVNRQVERKDL
ncbi:MAG TPA: HAMP domain-containing sensor histidine kinase [Ktedonobacteraceae bacterium]|nr:HAMP domain-containing sensor histidine kinase [Ktedonobacteraceae bacterium]